jgi:hypothetical protein
MRSPEAEPKCLERSYSKELSRPIQVLATNGARNNAANIIFEETSMNGIIYLIGLIVVIMFILSFLGLR